MKTTPFLLIPILSLGLLSACSDKAAVFDEEVKSVDWYLTHKDDMLAKYKECGYGHDETLGNTPNCKNAVEAFGTLAEQNRAELGQELIRQGKMVAEEEDEGEDEEAAAEPE